MLRSPTRIKTVTKSLGTLRSNPRKQPMQSRAKSTVTAIIEAAARILEVEGQLHFNTNTVAEVAGVSIGSLYQYFPDKNAIIGSLIARETFQFLEEVHAATFLTHGAEAIDDIILAAVQHQMRRPRLARVLDLEESRLPLDADTEQVRMRFAAALSVCLARPDLPPQADVSETAGDLLAIIRGLIDAAGAREEYDQDALVRRVRKAVHGYLKD